MTIRPGPSSGARCSVHCFWERFRKRSGRRTSARLAEEERLLPNGQRKRISVRTLRRWWKRLREEGVEGTFRRRRSDRGRPRAKQQALLERAVELKKEQPRRSDVVINRILKQEFGRGVPRSHALSPPPPRRRHASQAGRQPAEGSLPLDTRPGRCVVGRRLRAWTARAASGTCRARRVSPPGSTATAAMSWKPDTTSARTSTS